MNPLSRLPIQKLHDDARIPARAHPDDAGLDLHGVEEFEIAPGGTAFARTGIAMEIPPGHVGLVTDRSSLGKRGIKTAGGVIDSGYRGEVRVILWNLSDEPIRFSRGDRIAQLLILPIITPEAVEVRELSDAARGTSGFGSTGR